MYKNLPSFCPKSEEGNNQIRLIPQKLSIIVGNAPSNSIHMGVVFCIHESKRISKLPFSKPIDKNKDVGLRFQVNIIKNGNSIDQLSCYKGIQQMVEALRQLWIRSTEKKLRVLIQWPKEESINIIQIIIQQLDTLTPTVSQLIPKALIYLNASDANDKLDKIQKKVNNVTGNRVQKSTLRQSQMSMQMQQNPTNPKEVKPIRKMKKLHSSMWTFIKNQK